MKYIFLILISFSLLSFNNVRSDEGIAMIKEDIVNGKKCLASIKGNMYYESLQATLKSAVFNFNGIQKGGDRQYTYAITASTRFFSDILAAGIDTPACNKGIKLCHFC